MANTFKPVASLLSVDTNAKTVKGQKIGFLTGILYMAPYTLSGYNTCAMAEIAQCHMACLNTAGLGGVYPSIQLARMNKAKWFFENRETFMARIVKDIRLLVKRAVKLGLIPLVRLNGTSDIKWENVPVTVDGIEFPNVMAVFPDVQFYDYTKIANRVNLPSNYDLTFSYSGVPAYQRFVELAKSNGMRIAVVFRKASDIPARFIGMECIGGDNSDVRHLEPQGVIVALYAKGKAKHDQSGFVVDVKAHRVFALSAA